MSPEPSDTTSAPQVWEVRESGKRANKTSESDNGGLRRSFNVWLLTGLFLAQKTSQTLAAEARGKNTRP